MNMPDANTAADVRDEELAPVIETRLRRNLVRVPREIERATAS